MRGYIKLFTVDKNTALEHLWGSVKCKVVNERTYLFYTDFESMAEDLETIQKLNWEYDIGEDWEDEGFFTLKV